MKKKPLLLFTVTLLCGMMSGCCLNHDWQEATYTAPMTCANCGKTQGSPKPSYFEEHGIDVHDGPVNCTVDYIYYNEDEPETYCKVGSAAIKQTDCYVEPADEEGRQLIHLTLTKTYDPGAYYDAEQDVEYCNTINKYAIYDWYTGRMLPQRDFFGDDNQENSFTLEIDGVSYEISYSSKIQGKWDEWVYDEAGNAASGYSATTEYIFKVPEGYDGLVFCACPNREYDGEDASEAVKGLGEENGDGAVYYPANSTAGNYVEGIQCFRIIFP